MDHKKFLITGVLNTESVAYYVAEKLLSSGAEIVLTAPEFHLERTKKAAKKLTSLEPLEVFQMDANKSAEIDSVKEKLKEKWGRIDGVLHSIGYADPKSCLGEGYFWADEEKIRFSFETSSYSLLWMARGLAPVFGETGGSIVALTFDTKKIFRDYGWMNTAKELLESMIRQAAVNLGEKGVRVNGISAGPMETASGKAIDGFEEMSEAIMEAASLPWDMKDKSKEAVASTARFLLSDESELVTGNIIYVDGGGHLVMPVDRGKKE